MKTHIEISADKTGRPVFTGPKKTIRELQKARDGIAEDESVIDPHRLAHRFKGSLRRLDEDKEVSPANRELILAFDLFLKRRNVGTTCREKYINFLRPLARMLKKNFDKASKDDIKKLVDEIQASHYKPVAQYHLIKILVRFFKWLKNKDEDDDVREKPPEIAWIKLSKFEPKTAPLNTSVLLTLEDIKRMGDSAISLRDKALVKLLFETGCRASEILSLRLQDIEETEGGAFINITKSKTDLRKIFVCTFYPDLMAWVNAHPSKHDKTAPLWVNLLNGHKGEPLLYPAAVKVVRVCATRAGITGKKINLHSIRHASASFYSQTNLTESELKYRLGWSQSGKQLTRYLHINSDKIRDKLSGKNMEKINPPMPKRCPFCGVMVDGLSDRCVCGKPIDFQKTIDRNMAYLKLMADFSEYMRAHPELDAKAAGVLQGN